MSARRCVAPFLLSKPVQCVWLCYTYHSTVTGSIQYDKSLVPLYSNALSVSFFENLIDCFQQESLGVEGLGHWNDERPSGDLRRGA